jgi:hypothetical protein
VSVFSAISSFRWLSVSHAPSERHALLGPNPGFRKASTLG